MGDASSAATTEAEGRREAAGAASEPKEDETRRGPFLTASLDGPRARLLIGFAAFSAWVNLLVCFEGFLRDTVIYGGGVVHDPLFIAALLTGGAVLIAVPLGRFGASASPEAGDAALGLLGALAGAAGVALSALATAPGPAVTAIAAIIGIVAGLFIARYTLAWGHLITAFDIREMIVALCAALCLQWLPFIAVTFLGPWGKGILATVLPLLSWWCLRGCREPDAAGRESAPSSAGADRESRRIVGRTAAALFCFAFVVQLVWTCNVVMTAEPLGTEQFWLVYLCVLGISALVMFVVLHLMERWGAYRMELFYRAAFAFGVAGSAALPLAYNHLFFSYAVIYVAYALITATLWLLAWSIVFMRRLAARRVVGALFGLQCLALPCGFGAAKAMQLAAMHAEGTSLLPYVCLISVVMLVIAYAFILPERTLLLLSPRLLKLSHESLDARCRAVAASFGLTERETEIFGLLARGRDVSYIEKELFISRNTVNTHRKNLYRKLDIHTQQELLSLIEDSLS